MTYSINEARNILAIANAEIANITATKERGKVKVAKSLRDRMLALVGKLTTEQLLVEARQHEVEEEKAQKRAESAARKAQDDANREKKELARQAEQAKLRQAELDKTLAIEVCLHLDMLTKAIRQVGKAQREAMFASFEPSGPEASGKLVACLQKFIRENQDKLVADVLWEAIEEAVEVQDNVVLFEDHILDLKQVYPAYC